VNVDKDIPIPRARGYHFLYPFGEMNVGDSFAWEGDYDCLRAAASQYGRRHGMKFVTRKTRDGLRCWRIT